MEPDTKTRILDAAEESFAEDGFRAVSLRQIIGKAGVNLAAIHYHFGSKEALIEAVFARRIEPINTERFRLLDEVEHRARGGKLPLHKVIEAFVSPALRLARDPANGGAAAMRLYGRSIAERSEELQNLLHSQFKEVFRRFLEAFQRALPDIPPDVLCWRFHFMIGSMAHLLCMVSVINRMSGDLCETQDTERVLHELIHFAAAGLKAPVRA